MGFPYGFIGGFRSGTTLLVNLLGLHPLITAWYETKFLPEALRWLRVLRYPTDTEVEMALSSPPQPAGFGLGPVAARMRLQMEYDEARLRGVSPSGKGHYERYPLGADRIHYSLQDATHALDQWRLALATPEDGNTVASATGELIRCLGARHLAAEPAALLINKTPELPRFGAELRECVGPHKMILLVRDGREVVRSAAALGWAEPGRLAYLWRELILQSREAARGAPENYREVRYEDLVAAPAHTLDQVCDFLRIPLAGTEMVKAYDRLASVPISSSALRTQQPSDYALDKITLKEASDLLADLGYSF
jgi:hypothetical protein